MMATANAARGNLCAPALGHRGEHVIGALPAGQAVATGDGSMDRDGDGIVRVDSIDQPEGLHVQPIRFHVIDVEGVDRLTLCLVP